MSALALDPVYNDFAFTSGRMTYVTGAAEVAQKLNARFGFTKGSWFLDTQQGTPWFQALLVANPNVPALTSIIRSIILGVQGVASITTLTVNFDRLNRLITWNAVIVDDANTVIVGGRGQPFIVQTQKVAA